MDTLDIRLHKARRRVRAAEDNVYSGKAGLKKAREDLARVEQEIVKVKSVITEALAPDSAVSMIQVYDSLNRKEVESSRPAYDVKYKTIDDHPCMGLHSRICVKPIARCINHHCLLSTDDVESRECVKSNCTKLIML